MVFWILAAIITIGIAIWVYTIWGDYYWGGVVKTLMTALAVFIVWPFVLFLAAMLASGLGLAFTQGGDLVGTDKTKLVSLKSSEGVEGAYRGGIFASYGYINGTQIIKYLTQDEDGGIRLDSQKASESVVYEDSTEAYLETRRFEQENHWFITFGVLRTYETYEFHVPEGSVIREFEVAP